MEAKAYYFSVEITESLCRWVPINKADAEYLIGIGGFKNNIELECMYIWKEDSK